jgi:hypothetical protein
MISVVINSIISPRDVTSHHTDTDGVTDLAIIIPSKQITHVFLSALDLSGFVYIQMLKLYNCYMFRSTNRPSSGFSQYLLLENLHYFQRKIVSYI